MIKSRFSALYLVLVTPLALAIIDQVVLSAFSLLLNILLIRLWVPDQFGIFVMVLSLSLIGSSVLNALVGTQLSVLRPQASTDEEPELIASLWAANCVLTVGAVAVACVGVAAAGPDNVPFLTLSSGAMIAATLLREYVRSLLFSEFRPSTVLAIDGAFVAAASVGLGLLWMKHGAFGVPEVLLAIAGASVLSCLPSLVTRADQFSLRWGGNLYTRYARIWRGQARWALLGAVTYELMSRAHVFIVGACFGAIAVGILQAGEMLTRPLLLLAQAWERIAKPRFAGFAAAKDIVASRGLARLSILTALSASALYFLVLWLSWPLLTTYLFRSDYTNIGIVVVLWSLVALVQLVLRVYSTELQGFARFGELSVLGIIAALTTLLLLVGAVVWGTFEWSIVAVIGGNLLAVALAKMTLDQVYKGVQAGLPLMSAIVYVRFPILSGRWPQVLARWRRPLRRA